MNQFSMTKAVAINK